MPTTTIRQILGDRTLHGLGEKGTLDQAAQIMAAHGVGALVVYDGNGGLAGVLSERDLVFRAMAKGLPPETTPVSQVMTKDPVCVDIDASLPDTLRAHLGSAFRHMPVMENGRPVGLLSYRDIPAEYVMLFERFQEMTGARADEAP